MVRRAVLLLCLVGVAACAADPQRAPVAAEPVATVPAAAVPVAIGRDGRGILPTGGAAFTLSRDAAVFDQKDPAWARATLGDSGDTVADYGCTLTAVAMAAANLGEATDPGQLNTYLSAHGGYTPTGLFVWQGLVGASAGRLAADWHDTPTAAAIDTCLTDQNGFPIVQFLLGGRVQHWVVIVGKRGESWLVRDPLMVTAAPIPLETRAASIRALRCVRPSRP
jgi:hypothetical protein